MSVIAALANRIYAAYSAPASRRYHEALRRPGIAQRDVLMRVLSRNADSEAGRRHGFSDIRSVAAFRTRVPVHDYDALAQEVERMARGERNVLTTHDLLCFEPTSGSSTAGKLVPYTRELLSEFSAATQPWISDLLRRRPALRNGRSYWAVSPPARADDRTAGGTPIGMEHDSDYFPAIARMLLDRVLGTPRAVSRARSIDAARYLTLCALLRLEDLVLISVWNPSFLSLLAGALEEHWTLLLRDVERGTLSIDVPDELRRELSAALPAQPTRALQLRRRFGQRPPEDLGDLWTRLALISCWTDGHAARAATTMAERFPRVEIQGKGLLATEGVVSIPLFEAGGAVAAVTSHFLEFVPEHGGEARGVHEVETGGCYEVLLTTSGGLYRYRLKDLVRVDGWHRGTPILSFRGRADRTSDLVGEKLTPAFAESVLARASRATGVHPRFAMLAPVWGNPVSYRLFAECDPAAADELARAVERGLMESHHYALARRLGQLGAVEGVPVADAEKTYERVCVSRGQRAGTIKPASLDERLGWERELRSRVAAKRGVA